MTNVFQHSMEPVEVPPFDEHPQALVIAERDKRAVDVPGAAELPSAEEWTPPGDYYLG